MDPDKAGVEAYVARSTALSRWHLPGFRLGPVEIVCGRRRSGKTSPVAMVHTSRDLLSTHITALDGIPITTPARALFDIAATEHPKRVDLRDDLLPLVVEVQSDLFHGSLLDRQRDRERIAALRSAGFLVIEIWESEVWRRSDDVVERLVAARRELKARAA